ncbi:MAG: hypothetical protein OXQ94_07690 [Gemmatimonadota bacterium]|nr:hypothetical protein [Gemmatimonadota bacterium]MDE2871550.1 hypothetical protein [Gemmatimonadota bacterium]
MYAWVRDIACDPVMVPVIEVEPVVHDGSRFVFSTHDPMVMKWAGRLVRLVDGRVEE